MIRQLIILLFIPAVLLPQTPGPDSLTSRLSVLSEPPGAEVVLDSVLIGRSPVSNVPVSAGQHQLSMAFPSFRDWNAMIRDESIRVSPGESTTVTHEFGTTFNLVTVPSGVNVLYEERSLGTTPLFYKSPVPLTGDLRLRKDGFRMMTLKPGSIRGLVTMDVVDASVAASEMAIASSIERTASPWEEYVSAAGIIVSGIAAAYFKDQATKNFETYRITGNESALRKTQQYDDYSAVSLVLTQVSFGFLTYFLLSGE